MKAGGIRIIMWICISLLSLQFLGAGITKLLGRGWPERFAGWGYPLVFMYVVGSLEIIAVAGLLMSRMRKWSAIVLVLIMTGAAYTHVSSAEYSRVFHNTIVAGLALLTIRLDSRLHFK